MSRNGLSNNDELLQGDYLMSNNKEWKAVFQGDGNFVIYGWKPVWASDTNRSDAFRLIMQADSNLVMYNHCNHPLWATDTNRSGGHACHLQLTNDGKLVLYRNSEQVWSSATSNGSKKIPKGPMSQHDKPFEIE